MSDPTSLPRAAKTKPGVLEIRFFLKLSLSPYVKAELRPQTPEFFQFLLNICPVFYHTPHPPRKGCREVLSCFSSGKTIATYPPCVQAGGDGSSPGRSRAGLSEHSHLSCSSRDVCGSPRAWGAAPALAGLSHGPGRDSPAEGLSFPREGTRLSQAEERQRGDSFPEEKNQFLEQEMHGEVLVLPEAGERADQGAGTCLIPPGLWQQWDEGENPCGTGGSL